MSIADYELITTRSGVRMVQHGTLLSEVRSTPGPTHSITDVIAATLQAVKPGAPTAMLGFAGGGILAPLRAMGGEQPVTAVDLDDSGWRIFQRLSASWAGDLSFQRAEACAWLSDNPKCYEAIIEDLSVPKNSDVFKPAATWAELPALLYGRLKRGGVGLFNLVRPEDTSWENGVGRILKQGFSACVIEFEEYENRLLITGAELPTPRRLGREVRANLRRIRSRLASRISVRTCGSRRSAG